MATGSEYEYKRGLPRSIALVAPFPPPQAGMSLQASFTKHSLEREGLRVAVCNTNHLPTRFRSINQLLRPFLSLADCLRHIPGSQAVLIFSHYYAGFFAFTLPAGIIAKLFSKPVYYQVKGGRFPDFLERCGWLVLPVLRCAERIVVPSPFLEKCFNGYCIGTEILPDIIDLRIFQGAARLAPGGKRLLSARNLDDPVYGIDTIIKAIPYIQEKNKDVKLTILGDGPERDRLTKLVTKMDLTDVVEFAGQVPSERVAEYMRQTDLLVNASLADNYPNAILEAMAMGLPIVTTFVGGIPYLVEDGRTAIRFTIGDSHDLAKKVLQVLGNNRLYHQLSEKAGERISTLVWKLDRDGLAERIFG